MKRQALFPLKDKSKKIKCRLLQFLFGALRLNRLFIFPKGVYNVCSTRLFRTYVSF